MEIPSTRKEGKGVQPKEKHQKLIEK